MLVLVSLQGCTILRAAHEFAEILHIWSETQRIYVRQLQFWSILSLSTRLFIIWIPFAACGEAMERAQCSASKNCFIRFMVSDLVPNSAYFFTAHPAPVCSLDFIRRHLVRLFFNDSATSSSTREAGRSSVGIVLISTQTSPFWSGIALRFR